MSKQQKYSGTMREQLAQAGVLETQLVELYTSSADQVLPEVEAACQNFNAIAGEFGLPQLTLPACNPAKYAAIAKKRNQPVHAWIGHYRGRAHGTVTSYVDAAAAKLKANNASADKWVALDLIECIARDAVNTRASLAEAEVCTGKAEFGYKKPQASKMRQAITKTERAVNRMLGRVKVADLDELMMGYAQSVVSRFRSTFTGEIKQAIERQSNAADASVGRAEQEVLGAMDKAEKILREAETRKARADAHKANVTRSNAKFEKSATALVQKAKAVKGKGSVDEAATLIRELFELMEQYPWYFGRKPKPQAKAPKGKAKEAVNAPQLGQGGKSQADTESDEAATETPTEPETATEETVEVPEEFADRADDFRAYVAEKGKAPGNQAALTRFVNAKAEA